MYSCVGDSRGNRPLEPQTRCRPLQPPTGRKQEKAAEVYGVNPPQEDRREPFLEEGRQTDGKQGADVEALRLEGDQERGAAVEDCTSGS